MRKIAEFIVKKRILFFVLFAALIVYCVFSLSKVKVEYDISAYLPENTDTKRAIEIMNEEFVTYGTCTVLLEDISSEAADKLHKEIAEIDGVKIFSFDNSEKYYKDGFAKFSVTFVGTNKDAQSVAAYEKTIHTLDESGYKYSVPSPLVNSYADTLASEMVIIIAIAAAVILVVLLLTSKSFAEIIAFPVVFVVAALLNMGTNYWLGTISFVSNTVCIILQLALAIDYAIILCHRFTEEKEKTESAEDALITALAKSIPEIGSSSLTTVSGLVALMFMQLTLGFDLGMVLAKSIVCSLLTVFLLMPGLLYYLSKLMDKSRHRSFVPKLRFWGAGVMKARYVLIPAFALLFALGAVMSQRIVYCYSTEAIDTDRPTETRVAKERCQEIFGYDNMFVILVPNGDRESEREILDIVGSEPLVTSALGLSGIEISDGVYLTDSVDYTSFAKIAGTTDGAARLLFMMYAGDRGELYNNDYKVPLLDLMGFLFDNINSLPLSAEVKAKLEPLEGLLSMAKDQLAGKTYSRLVFNIAAKTESKETFALIERITPKVKAVRGDAIFAGSSMSAYDLNASFSYDNLLITLLTVAFIYIILAFTFRSPCIPIVLVLVIQGAIFLNFSLPVFMGNNLFFFTYLIVSAIQMGATIDYAILLTNRFLSLKQNRDKREAIVSAVSGAFPTVFTSGTIMCVAGFLVGGLTSDPLIASIGNCLGTGTLISIVYVLVFLPVLLYVLDPILSTTIIKKRLRAADIKLPNPSIPPVK